MMISEKKPVLINIGRGSIITENDLIAALEKEWLSYSVLDVYDKEPLPKESPLWLNKKVSPVIRRGAQLICEFNCRYS